MLIDRTAIISALPDGETSASLVRAFLQAAEAATKRLDLQLDKTAVFAAIVEGVELRRDSMQIALDLRPFVSPHDGREHGDEFKIAKLVPLQIKRWGFEMLWCSAAKCHHLQEPTRPCSRQ